MIREQRKVIASTATASVAYMWQWKGREKKEVLTGDKFFKQRTSEKWDMNCSKFLRFIVVLEAKLHSQDFYNSAKREKRFLFSHLWNNINFHFYKAGVKLFLKLFMKCLWKHSSFKLRQASKALGLLACSEIPFSVRKFCWNSWTHF